MADSGKRWKMVETLRLLSSLSLRLSQKEIPAKNAILVEDGVSSGNGDPLPHSPVSRSKAAGRRQANMFLKR